ncbi:MAG: PAS domain S-box protein [Acidobacteria bacterium]|nr:PAS domain S-box protein [Acidobacteriota bacterium]
MQKVKMPRWLSMWKILGAVGLAFWLTDSIPQVKEHSVFIFFVLAVIYCAWDIGFGGGLCAAVLGLLLCDYFFYPPLHSFGATDFEHLMPVIGFVIVSVVGSALAAKSRKDAARLLRINRFYSLLVNAHTVIKSGDNLQQTCEGICRVAVESGLFKMAWVGYGEGEQGLNTPVAFWGLENELQETEFNARKEMPCSGCPEGAAVRAGHHYVCNEIAKNAQEICWSAVAQKHGYHSSATFPLTIKMRIAGIITFYAEQEKAFGQQEVELLTTLAANLATAIEALEKEARQRAAEAALQQSEAQLQAIIDNASLQIYVKDLQGRLVLVNHSVEEVLGLPRQEILGKTNHELFAQEIADQYHANDRIVLLSGKPLAVEETVVMPQGLRTGYSVKFPLVNESGEIYAICGISSDITERKQQEEALRQQAQIINQIHSSIITLNLDGVVTSWNHGAEQLYGYTMEEVLGEPIAMLYPSQEGIEETFRVILAALHQEGKYEIEAERMTKSGDSIFIRSFLSFLRDAEGLPVGIIANAFDLTQERKAREEFRRFATVVEQIAESVVITDPEGRIQYVNPTFEKMTGYSREEVLGKTPGVVKSGKQEAAFYEQLWATIKSGKVWNRQLINKKKDGTLYHAELVISPILDANGKLINFVGTQQDVTKEAALESQLVQSQKMEAIGRLAGGVAHDFNNLLTAIIGYSQLSMARAGVNDLLRSNLEEIEKAGRRAANLTSQLLAFSRKQIIQPSNLVINEVITNLQKMLTRLIGEDIDLQANLDLDLGTVRMDRTQVEQVLMNLAVNSRDAMPEGGKIIIETTNISLDAEYAAYFLDIQPGDYVMLAISDTGIGMDQETISRIFEPFFTTKEQGKGTGLGLSTVYGIVKQNGGHIEVLSAIGQGTTFKIYLPRLAETQVETQVERETLIIRGGGEKILLVEDDSFVRDLAGTALREFGYVVTESASGAEAFQLLSAEEQPFDLLLTDVVMPQMNGHELAQKASGKYPDLKVLYMSGYTDRAIVSQGVLHHGTAFIQKPFTLNGLAQKVREALDRSW